MKARKNERRHIKIQKIIRRSRYGLYKQEREFSDIITKLWSYDKLEEVAKQLLKESNVKNKKSESILDNLFEISFSKLNEVAGSFGVILETIYEKASKKVMDENGEYLDIPAVTYESQIKELATESLSKVNGLGEEQKTKFRELLIKGQREGTPASEIAKQAKKELPEMVEWKAKRIARTELNTASTKAMETQLSSAGFNTYRWIAATTSKKKPCDICLGYHREVFKIGQGKMPVRDSHPNCRCVIVANTEEDAE